MLDPLAHARGHIFFRCSWVEGALVRVSETYPATFLIGQTTTSIRFAK